MAGPFSGLLLHSLTMPDPETPNSGHEPRIHETWVNKFALLWGEAQLFFMRNKI